MVIAHARQTTVHIALYATLEVMLYAAIYVAVQGTVQWMAYMCAVLDLRASARPFDNGDAFGAAYKESETENSG